MNDQELREKVSVIVEMFTDGSIQRKAALLLIEDEMQKWEEQING
jgi:hypothetical protein